MDIKQFDLVELNNGKHVVILDILDDGKAFIVEPKPGKDGRPPKGEEIFYTVKLNEIAQNIS